MAIWTEHRSLERRARDLSVGHKLFYAFATLTLVFGLAVACLLLAIDQLGDANSRIVDEAGPRAVAAADLRFAAAGVRAAQDAYVLDDGSSRATFDQALVRFDRTLDELRVSTHGPVEEALINRIATSYQAFRDTDRLIWDATRSMQRTVARNLSSGPERLVFESLSEDASLLADLAEQDRDAAIADFERTSSNTFRMGIALGLTAIGLMIGATLIITRLIRDPLRRVQDAAERAADGDLDAEAQVNGDDETGRLAAAFNRMLSTLRLREEMLRNDHRRQETESMVHRALEMSDDEQSALDVVGRTMLEVLPHRSCELLIADNSKANLEQAVVSGPHPDGPGCPVASPFACVAVRSGSAVSFPSSASLDACPHLRGRGPDEISALCVPVTFMGRAMGVIHAVGAPDKVPTANEIDLVSMLAARAGARIGMLRMMVRTSVQASTDSLTGLINRRTFQTRIRSMRRSNTEFTLVMADIDHFKRLNDTHGHEMGDRALQTFCDVAKNCMRHNDLLARWGGEEFAFAFAGLQPAAACSALDRIRLELAGRLSTSDLPGFTVSYGLVAAGRCGSLEEAIRRADDALYEAKAKGRDCSVIADEADDDTDQPYVSSIRMAERAEPREEGVLAGLSQFDDPLDI